MNIYLYSGFAYLLTAVLSLAVIGVIVVLTKCFGSGGDPEETQS